VAEEEIACFCSRSWSSAMGGWGDELPVAVAILAATGWGGSDAEAPDAAVRARVSAPEEVGIEQARASAVNYKGRKRGEGNSGSTKMGD
jgi:hypothetical protein